MNICGSDSEGSGARNSTTSEVMKGMIGHVGIYVMETL